MGKHSVASGWCGGSPEACHRFSELLVLWSAGFADLEPVLSRKVRPEREGWGQLIQGFAHYIKNAVFAGNYGKSLRDF